MGHRRFFSEGHKFRLNRVQFNGNIEDRDPPKQLSGSKILEQVKNINITFGKKLKSLDKRKKIVEKTLHIKHNNGRRKAYSLNFHIGSLICCDTTWM